jgi:MFS family permease
VGSQVTLLALPLTAVLYLHASAGQVGLLTAAGLAAYCGPSLFAGVMADRMRRRPLMIAADIGRTLVIGLVPVLAWLHSLDMPVLYAAALTPGRPDRHLRGGLPLLSAQPGRG